MNIKAAKAIGAGNYDAAIAAYERNLRGTREDALALSMIAQCYEWKGDAANAIKYAERALSADPNDFNSLSVAARYWNSMKDEGQTYRYACRILENLPEPLPEVPNVILLALHPFIRISRRLRDFANQVSADFSDVTESDRKIIEWARGFKHWYETSRGVADDDVKH